MYADHSSPSFVFDDSSLCSFLFRTTILPFYRPFFSHFPYFWPLLPLSFCWPFFCIFIFYLVTSVLPSFLSHPFLSSLYPLPVSHSYSSLSSFLQASLCFHLPHHFSCVSFSHFISFLPSILSCSSSFILFHVDHSFLEVTMPSC